MGEQLKTFQEFPPRQKPGGFSIDHAIELLMNPKDSRLQERTLLCQAYFLTNPSVVAL